MKALQDAKRTKKEKGRKKEKVDTMLGQLHHDSITHDECRNQSGIGLVQRIIKRTLYKKQVRTTNKEAGK